MSLKDEGFRFMVSPDRKQCRWIHPAIMAEVPEENHEGWADCTDMDDDQFYEFMTE